MALFDSETIASLVEKEAQLQGVDPFLARTIFSIENGGRTTVDTNTVSPRGALGLMQVMPGTYKGLVQQKFLSATNDPATPLGQIKAGVAALKERMTAGITNPVELAISYNASPQVLEQYKKTGVLPPETTNYISRLSAAYQGKGIHMPATSAKTSETTSSRNIPESVQQGMLDASKGFSDFAAGAFTTLGDLSKQLLGASTATQTAVKDEAAARIDSGAASTDLELNKLSSQHRVLNTYGIDLDNPDNKIQENMKAIGTANTERMQLAQQIAQMRSVTPLSDPIGWLANIIPQSQAIARHNALAQLERSSIANIKTLNDMAKETSQLQPASIEQALKDKQLAEARVTAAEAATKIASIEGTVSMQLAKNLTEQANMMGQDIQQRTQIARILWEKQTQSWALAQNEKATKEDIDQLAPINMMVTQLGLAPFTPKAFKALSRDAQERLTEAGHFGRFGKDVGESITTMHLLLGDSGFQELARKDPIRGKFLQQAIQGGKDALADMEAKSMLPQNAVMAKELSKLKDEDRLAYGITAWARGQKELLKSNDYTKLPTDSPYKLDYQYAANLAQLKDNSFAKFVREYAPNGTKQAGIAIDDKMLLQKAVADATLDPSQVPKIATDLRLFYETGLANQNSNRGVSSLGLDVPRNYPVWAKINMYNKGPVQMLNPQDIERWITMEVTAGIVAKQPFSSPLRKGTL